MRRAWLLVFALLAADPLSAAEPAPFEGISGLRFEYYEVEGRTRREIYNSLMARGPNNGQHWGITRSQSRDRWRTMTQGSSCRVVDAETSLSITVLLPRHIEPDELSEDVWEFWRGISDRIRRHEAGHARIAWNHRNDFKRAAAKASCRSIDRVAKEVGDNVRALQKAFDAETDYGRKGAPRLIL
jgi:predicted secreted Zn-dependent protease